MVYLVQLLWSQMLFACPTQSIAIGPVITMPTPWTHPNCWLHPLQDRLWCSLTHLEGCIQLLEPFVFMCPFVPSLSFPLLFWPVLTCTTHNLFSLFCKWQHSTIGALVKSPWRQFMLCTWSNLSLTSQILVADFWLSAPMQVPMVNNGVWCLSRLFGGN